MRGKNGSNELAIAFVHGRIDRELEVWAERFSIPSMEFKQELGTVLINAQSNRVSSSRLHETTTAEGRHAVATLEVAIGTHGSDASGNRTGRNSSSEVPTLTAGEVVKKNWYKNLSPKQVQEMNLARLKKRKDLLGKQMYKGLLAKMKGKTPKVSSKGEAVKVGRNGRVYPVQTLEEKRARHRVHIARYEAKKKGLPLPPLPPEAGTTTAA